MIALLVIVYINLMDFVLIIVNQTTQIITVISRIIIIAKTGVHEMNTISILMGHKYVIIGVILISIR